MENPNALDSTRKVVFLFLSYESCDCSNANGSHSESFHSEICYEFMFVQRQNEYGKCVVKHSSDAIGLGCMQTCVGACNCMSEGENVVDGESSKILIVSFKPF